MSKEYTPIWNDMKKILAPLREGRNVVIVAPTGSGKTTQVPQAILDSGLAGGGKIFVVEPRRIVCRSAARYVATERNTAVGTEIGYAVRYDTQSSFITKICFITDGVLMKFIENDPQLSKAAIVIFDEFHERRINADISLSLLRAAQKKKPGLQIVVMSATMDTEALASYLDAAVIKSSALSFPVFISYIAERPEAEEISQAAVDKVMEYHISGKPGHILVFLPGKGAILAAQQLLEEKKLEELLVLPLHGELTSDEQDRIFQYTDKRKVILATNVAESSLTIPGVRIVIDSGLERRQAYDFSTGVNTLKIVNISRASADQRTGRAGREGPGHCVRLWNEEENISREPYAPAEIHRGDIGPMVLSLLSLGVKDIESFDFFEKPDPLRISSAVKTLKVLGAVDESNILTHTGQQMLKLSLPPRYGRMIVEAERNGTLKEVSIIVALLASGTIFAYPRGYSKDEIDNQHKVYATNSDSDCFTLLNIFAGAKKNKFGLEWFRENFISYDTVIEARLMRWEILRSLHRVGVSLRDGLIPNWRIKEDEVDTNNLIRRAIISGLLDQVAVRKKGRRYSTVAGVDVLLNRSSVVESDLIVGAGFMRTRDDYIPGITCATIVDEEMLKQFGPQLFRVERRVLKRFPATKTVQIVEDLRYLDLVLRRKTRLMSETAESLPQKLAPLTALVSQLNKP